MPRFTQVTPRLPVKDLRRTIDFYVGQLGFVTDVLWPEREPTFAILCRDTTSLGFFEPNEHQRGAMGYAELYIQVTDALALHDWLAQRVAIEWGPEIYSYGRREFAFRDPDGYLVILTEPIDEPPTPDEPGGGEAA